MTHPNRRRGDEFERACVDHLRGHGFPHAERAYGGGRPDDCGDIDGLAGITVQCKAEKRIDLAGYLTEAEAQRQRAGSRFALAIVKRRQKSIGQAYVVMSLDTFCGLVGDG